MTISAKTPENVTIRVGGHAISKTGKITVKVIEVLEDSRCPVNVTCVWAGNAKIKISLKKGRKAARTFELNSTLTPKTILFEGYEVSFVDLTPRPGEMVKAVAFPKVVTVSITKAK
ncbi:MAG: hypothetical protein ABL952_06780 [Pyrinomonadaceae bacterium]